MVFPLLLLLAAPDDVAITTYHALTSATPACSRPAGDDVVVCGRRAADRYRVPLVIHDPGDPAYEGVPAERERLFARTDNCEEKSIFLVGCGSFGIKATVNASGTHVAGERALAP
ncbi:hypothetical protein PX554_05670 [Sphingomonas sp. H39-1-10]|uniref:hypothetical protein n=1 Tax=Sphingomonas TaxID=13687 RepID=UPI00088440C0|nr:MULTISPECIES: hypothetical protein [Sphingomonas]MDF0487610.1 hypothetical protein [Sphingomonas pollutisoli]SDA16977.1 hypothetical protein SAMN03159340_00996 [Sphingomonas sp. NFR15]